MTFSIVGRCDRTGMIGAVIASSSPAVGARCIWARARVGAVASQNVTDPTLRDTLLGRLAAGDTAPSALAKFVATAEHSAYRQLVVIDAAGRGAVRTGERALGRHADAIADGCAAAGNLLADVSVVTAMTARFVGHRDDPLGDRLIGALRAGRDAGGEEGPVHSAALLVVDRVPWPVVDLRVDWTDEDPVEELAALWARWKPLADSYVVRALRPDDAPPFGVPGDSTGADHSS